MRRLLRDAAHLARARLRRLKSGFGLAGARVVFDPRYALPTSELVDGERGRKSVEYLLGEGGLSARDVIPPSPLALSDVLRVHDAEYLASLDDPERLTRIYGQAHRSPRQLFDALEAQRWATAGTVTAARLALRYPWLKSPFVNLGGGFHHARRDQGGGFCALNDVAIAVDAVRLSGFSGNVLVVDLDYHQGDGTRSMFADDPKVTTCSIHSRTIDDGPAVAAIDVELGPGISQSTYLRVLSETLDEAFARTTPALIFYVAGADIAASDTLGDFRVSDDGVMVRDREVMSRAKGIPTVVVMAGGYGHNAWRFPARLALWLLTGDDVPIPTAEQRALRFYRNIRRDLSSTTLTGEGGPRGEEDFMKLTEADLYGDLMQRPDPRFLGFYSTFGMELVFERYGLAEHLRGRGYDHFVVDTEPVVGRDRQSLKVFGDDTRREVLIELVVGETFVESAGRLLSIEWLLLQDPRRAAAPDRALLPGQKHPGLGCLHIVVGMLVMAAERLAFEGVTLVPAHFHVAARAKRLFTFLEPAHEARYLALARATHGMTLGAASAAIAAGRVVDRKTGAPVLYEPGRMVLASRGPLEARLASESYARAVEDEASRFDLELTP